MRLAFTKMHGLGNDFVVFDAVRQTVELTPERVRWLADRRFGIGCDQVLVVERPRAPDTEFYYRIFNADGGEVEQCGNGARCFARFVRDQGLSEASVIHVGTAGGPIRLVIEDDGQVRVNMGRPRLAPAKIPFLAEHEAPSYPLEVGDRTLEIGVVSMGNPHAIVRVEEVATATVETLGPAIEGHSRFPNRVNAGFLQVVDAENVKLRVYERGVGETLACGTGACAAVVYGRLRGWLGERVRVGLPGGALVISWRGDSEPVWMTGPATRVFEGVIEL